jgi:methionyl-tRNA synthetase
MTRDIDWGIPVPLPGLGGQPEQEALRLVRRGHRLPLGVDRVGPAHRRPGALARLVERPRRALLLLPGQGQHHLPRPDLAGRTARVCRSRGSRGRAGAAYGVLNLPTEVVASEFMTMEGKQFSTSPRPRHLCARRAGALRPRPAALLHLRGRAGNQDADFTWAEFVQRNNSELVAGWGNLVNRTASMIHKRFGEIPAAGPLEPIDEELLAAIRGGFDTVGALIERQRFKAGIGEVMRLVGWPMPTSRRPSRSSSRVTTSASASAPCCTCSLRRWSTSRPCRRPSCRTAPTGSTGSWAARATSCRCPSCARSTDLDDGPAYPVIMGDYGSTPRWASRPVVPGTPIGPPTPVFTKFDPSVVDEEIARMRADG